MTPWHEATTVLLVLLLSASLWRVSLGPTRADRMISAQLFGTTGVAVLALSAESLQAPSLHDAVLVLALLAATAMVVFARRAGSTP